jgi:gluconolactonase
MHPSLTVYNRSVFNFISSGWEIETLASDCIFTEGPLWNAEGFYLFSDIPANVIYKIDTSGNKQVYLSNSGTDNRDDPDLKTDQAGSNALAYDAAGALLICRHGSHGIGKYKGEVIEPFIENYHGKPMNSPNDLILHSNGKIFFSDPPYGLKDSKLNPEKFQPVAGVYCWNNGEMKLICDRYQYPNGVCLSPDEKLLYICSNKPFENFICVYHAESHKFIEVVAKENSDGMECDPSGNIYLCNRDGLIILDCHGQRLALIQLPTIPSNICLGGKELKDVFITGREQVYLIRGLLK